MNLIITNVYYRRKCKKKYIQVFARNLNTNSLEDYWFENNPNLRRFFEKYKLSPIGVYEIDIQEEEIHKKRELSFNEMKRLSMLAWDIEVENPRRFPDPNRDKIILIGGKQDEKEQVLASKNFVRKEIDAMEIFAEMIKKYKPWFFVGFNSDGFDSKYMLERAKKLGLKKFTLSPYWEPPQTMSLPVAFGTKRGVTFPGMINLDLLYFAKLLPLAQSNLEFLAKTLKLENYKTTAFEIFRSDIKRIKQHNLSDIRNTYEIAKRFLPSLYIVSKMTYGTLEYVTRAINTLPHLIVNKLCIDNGKDPRQYNLINKKGIRIKPTLKEGIYDNVFVTDLNLEVAEKLSKVKLMESWAIEKLLKIYNSSFFNGIKIDDFTKLFLVGLIRKSINFFYRVSKPFKEKYIDVRKKLEKFRNLENTLYFGKDYVISKKPIGIEYEQKVDKALLIGNMPIFEKDNMIMSTATLSHLSKNVSIYTSETIKNATMLILNGEEDKAREYIKERLMALKKGKIRLEDLRLIIKKRGKKERIKKTRRDEIFDKVENEKLVYEPGSFAEIIQTKNGPIDIDNYQNQEIDWRYYKEEFNKKVGKLLKFIKNYSQKSLIEI